MKLMHINFLQFQNNTNKKHFGTLPKKYKVVDDYLIRGPHPHIYDVFKLKKEGVNRIYDFRHEGIRGFKWIERLACKITGIEYKRQPYSFLEGKFPTQDDYERISREVLINGKNGGKTLFHCNSGTHRTALMSAFYDITKGKPLEICKKENTNFKETVDKNIKKHIVEMMFFSRNKVIISTKNPIIKAKNIFNNMVEEATNKAYNFFMDMMQK